jgi:site-specific DNA recombinase
MTARDAVALYARVSSESQARDNTIASQVTALRERIAADGFQLEPDHNYVDEGYSGAILFRPALERLRDAIAGGQVERIYVHAPDRLARCYAHQLLLIVEFRRAGTEVVFLNHPIGTAEDDLLLQVQGVIGEYERDPRTGPARPPACRTIRIRQCADGGSLRVSLRESNSWRRNSAFRGG